MGIFEQEIFGVNSEQALRFFIDYLREENLPRGYSFDELCYVGSVLAHYTQTPRYNPEGLLSADLAELFDLFVLGQIKNNMFSFAIRNPDILEMAGSQVLLFAGFFRDQMRRRHNVHFFDSIGASFYQMASERCVGKKQLVMGRVADNFAGWTRICNGLNRKIRNNRYLI